MIWKTRQIQDVKKLLGQQPTIKAEVPDFLYIATDNARCPKAEVYIKPGDHVDKYQLIGIRHAAFFDQPIHATCSGTFVGFEKHYHRNGKLVDFIKIANDHKETAASGIQDRSDEEIAKLTREDMSKILKDCAMVGLGGSSFPTYVKFNTDKPIKTILIDAIECEPYIVTDQRMLLEEQADIIKGITYIQQAFHCKETKICIKKKHKDLIGLYNRLLERYPDSGISICPVGNFYPQGWEIAMIKSATGIDVPSGHLPSEYGIINFNLSTVYGIYLAIKHNQPVTDRIVSITGEGIKFPTNLYVRVGTLLKDLLPLVGGYKDESKPKAVILGGPMMGASVPNDDCVITKTVTSVLVFNHADRPESPCIRCGSCVASCPVGLQPVTVMNVMKTMPVDKAKIKELNPLKCIECGLCSYSCTSHIEVKEYVKRAKVIARLP